MEAGWTKYKYASVRFQKYKNKKTKNKNFVNLLFSIFKKDARLIAFSSNDINNEQLVMVELETEKPKMKVMDLPSTKK